MDGRRHLLKIMDALRNARVPDASAHQMLGAQSSSGAICATRSLLSLEFEKCAGVTVIIDGEHSTDAVRVETDQKFSDVAVDTVSKCAKWNSRDPK